MLDIQSTQAALAAAQDLSDPSTRSEQSSLYDPLEGEHIYVDLEGVAAVGAAPRLSSDSSIAPPDLGQEPNWDKVLRPSLESVIDKPQSSRRTSRSEAQDDQPSSRSSSRSSARRLRPEMSGAVPVEVKGEDEDDSNSVVMV